MEIRVIGISPRNIGEIWIRVSKDRWYCKDKTFILIDMEVLSDIKNKYLKEL